MDECSDSHCAKRQKVNNLEVMNDNLEVVNDSVDFKSENNEGDANDLSFGNTEKTSFSEDSQKNLKEEDNKYFSCYADLNIHKVMIEDHARTKAYQTAILNNYKLFYKKVVADVGAGTGILSIFCCQAGARKVYAIEGSSVADEAKKVIASNGFSDKITVIHGKVEDITLPEEVDIIVSEWMGYMVMYESMLSSVLHARDNWLKKDGCIFPEEVKMYLAPVSDFEDHKQWVEFCEDVRNMYKIDMSSLVPTADQQMQGAVRIISLDPTAVQAHASCFASLHLPTIDASSIECVKGSFKTSCFGYTEVNGFIVWFTAHFPNNVVLSTSPYGELTHWEQAVMYISPVQVHQDSIINGELCIRRHEIYHRFLSVELEYQVSDGEKIFKKYELKD